MATEEHPAIPHSDQVPDLSTYLLRWQKLRDGASLQSEVLESKNRHSLDGFRSIFWSKWLNLYDKTDWKKWPSNAEKGRGRFKELRKNHLDDKRLDPNLHPSENNPLSQDGPWDQ